MRCKEELKRKFYFDLKRLAHQSGGDVKEKKKEKEKKR